LNPNNFIEIYEIKSEHDTPRRLSWSSFSYAQQVEARKLAYQVQQLSERLKASIDQIEYKTPRGCKGEHLAKLKEAITPEDLDMKRVFINDLHRKGGLAGAFWHSLNKTERKGIRINGEETETVGLPEIFLSIAYGTASYDKEKCSSHYEEVAGDDAYHVIKWMLEAQSRSHSKPAHVLQALSHSEDDHDTIINGILKAHQPIASKLFRGLGSYHEVTVTRIYMAVADKLLKSGVVALPCSEGLIVGKSQASTALQTINKTITEYKLGILKF
jgi:hypothetical protein